MIEYKLRITRQTILLALKSFAIALISVTALIFIAGAITRATNGAVSARDDFAMLTKKYGIVDQLARDADSVASATEKLESATPTMDDITLVEEYLNATAAKTMNDITPHFSAGIQPSESTALAELPIAIQLAGTKQSLVDFLRTLETAPYIFSVKSVTLSFAHGTPDAPLSPDALTAQISATVFLETKPR